MKRKILFVMLLAMPIFMFAQSSRTHKTFTVGDDLGFMPQFNKSQGFFRASGIYSILPWDKGCVIKLETDDARFKLEVYAETGTRMYGSGGTVLEVTKLGQNSFEADVWNE